TQTRRIVKPAEVHACEWLSGPWRRDDDSLADGEDGAWSFGSQGVGDHDPSNFFVDHRVLCPYGEPGDRLWVRETFREDQYDATDPMRPETTPYVYAATFPSDGEPARKWKPSIHMPRRLSRIDLDVLSIRVERLQDISENDARAEGVVPFKHIGADQRIAGDLAGRTQATHPHTLAFAVLWDEINGARASWTSNPWVWVVGFKRIG